MSERHCTCRNLYDVILYVWYKIISVKGDNGGINPLHRLQQYLDQ